MRKRGTSKHCVYTVPSRQAIAVMRAKVSAATYRSTLHQDLDELLFRLNWMLRGWANYFRHGVSKKVFNRLDYHAWRRICCWLRREHGRISWDRFGDGSATKAGDSPTTEWCSPGASSVAVTRYRYRGSKITTPWTPNPAAPTS